MSDFQNGYKHILASLLAEMLHRDQHDDWIERERMAVVVAANEWADLKGLRTMTARDAEGLEVMAMWHVDYASKYALHAAEWIHGKDK